MKVGLETCIDLFEKLKFEKDRLDSNWSDYDFFNFMVTAWHLQNDWLGQDKANRPLLAMRKINSSPFQMKEVMKISRDLANGSKHFQLDKKSVLKKVVTEVHAPEIMSWHSYYFGAKSAISTNMAYYEVTTLVAVILSYFMWVFDDEMPSEFPQDIKRLLDYSKLIEHYE